jgi:hypothetical protein
VVFGFRVQDLGLGRAQTLGRILNGDDWVWPIVLRRRGGTCDPGGVCKIGQAKGQEKRSSPHMPQARPLLRFLSLSLSRSLSPALSLSLSRSLSLARALSLALSLSLSFSLSLALVLSLALSRSQSLSRSPVRSGAWLSTPSLHARARQREREHACRPRQQGTRTCNTLSRAEDTCGMGTMSCHSGREEYATHGITSPRSPAEV